jgi:hypothetical protein
MAQVQLEFLKEIVNSSRPLAHFWFDSKIRSFFIGVIFLTDKMVTHCSRKNKGKDRVCV